MGGWKSRKWKLKCDDRYLLLKELSDKRYNESKVIEIEKSLKVQKIANEKFAVAPCIIDRGRINYQLQDVGRAIMSFAYNGNGIDLSKVKKFEHGYNSVQSLNKEDIINSLRLIWVIEVAWWFNMFVFCQSQTTKISEFKDQILYLTDHYKSLDGIFKSY